MSAELADSLARARVEARTIEAGLIGTKIANVHDAYEIQSQLAARPGHSVQGWKVSALNAEQQQSFLTDRPVAGALLSPFVHNAPSLLSAKQFVVPLLECEVAFVLGADLPPRDQPYSRTEIEAVVEAVIPAIEIADSRCPADAPALLKLADSMGNGAFIAGAAVRNWHEIDLDNLTITLTRDGSIAERGSSVRILGNPLLAVVALANAQPLPAVGLKRGHMITTGTCTTPVPLKAGVYIGEFGALGNIRLDIVA